MFRRWFSKKRFDPIKLAPDGLVDLHNHVLPGIDDGAGDLEESLAMLSGMAELGYREIAVTPHFDNQQRAPGVETQLQLIEQINRQRTQQLPTIQPAAEILFDDLFVEFEPEGVFPRLGAGRSYLVEFGHHMVSVPSGIEQLVFRLGVQGVTLVLAHPERFDYFARIPDALVTLRRGGLLTQMDVMSLAGRYGPKVKKTAFAMLDRDMVDLVSSDLHSAADLPVLRNALEELADWDPIIFQRLTSLHPRQLLWGLPLDEVEP